MPEGSPLPRMSIVTSSYNQTQFIEKTIRSVLLQGYPDLEYIISDGGISDGGSTDGSAEIIRECESWLAYWVSEKDRGQSHAIMDTFFRQALSGMLPNSTRCEHFAVRACCNYPHTIGNRGLWKALLQSIARSIMTN